MRSEAVRSESLPSRSHPMRAACHGLAETAPVPSGTNADAASPAATAIAPIMLRFKHLRRGSRHETE